MTEAGSGVVPVGGCILCKELQEFGAGRHEGWLHDHSHHLNVAISPPLVAVANRKSLLIIDWSSQESFKTSIGNSLFGHGNITCIQWLCFHRYRALAMGTSQGFLLIYSASGDLLHQQLLYQSEIKKLRIRGVHHTQHENSATNELCVIFTAAILRIDAANLQSLLKRCFDNSRDVSMSRNAGDGSRDHFEKLEHQIWNVSKCAPCIDGTITGILSPPLMEDQSEKEYYSAIVLGANATFGVFRLSAEKRGSLVSAIFSKVLPATVSTITSFTKMFWGNDKNPAKTPDIKPPTFAQASMMTCLKDGQRKGEMLAISPSGSLVAIADSLGRILLVDTQALVVIRMWKGYRDAHCLFVEVPLHENMSKTYDRGYGKSKKEFCLCLAIHAPRRGVVEVWRMRTGPRILSLQCAKGCLLLQPAANLSTASDNSTFNYTPLIAYLVNGDSGEIFFLNPIIQSS